MEAPLPDVYVKRDALGTISLLNLKEKAVLVPAFIVGLGFDQLWSQSQVNFDLAKRIVQLRSEHFPRFTLGTKAALDIAVRAGLQLGGSPVGPGEGEGEKQGAIDKMAKKLGRRLSAAQRVELGVLAKRYVEACGGKIDIGQWIAASDLTASRAALAICGDVGAAAHVLTLEPSEQSPLPVAERIYDLLAYSVSDNHFAVRSALGLHVNLGNLGNPANLGRPEVRLSGNPAPARPPWPAAKEKRRRSNISFPEVASGRGSWP